jgi:hypothetical protein
MFSAFVLGLSALLASPPHEALVANILSILQRRPTALKRSVYPDTTATDQRAELVKCAIQTACIQSMFYEYTDAYLLEIDRTPFEFSRIDNRDEFMSYTLEQEQSQGLLDRFIPGLTNRVQGTIAALRTENQWPEPAARAGITATSFPEELYSQNLSHCFNEDIVTRVAASVTEVHASAYLSNTRSTRTYGGWERSPNGGIRPIVLDNPTAVFERVASLRNEDPDSVVEPVNGETQAFVNFRGNLESFISAQGERF